MSRYNYGKFNCGDTVVYINLDKIISFHKCALTDKTIICYGEHDESYYRVNESVEEVKEIIENSNG